MHNSKFTRPFPLIGLAVLLVILGLGTACSSSESHVKRGTDYFKAGKYDEARIEFLNALKVDRQNAMAIRYLGLIWSDSGAPLEAYRYLQTAQDLFPKDRDVRAKTAANLLALGQLAEARRIVLGTLEQIPGDDEAVQILAETAQQPEVIKETRAILARLSPDKAAYHLASATMLLREGNQEAVSIELARAIEMEPKSVLAHLATGLRLWAKEDSSGAAAELKTAAALAPPRSLARLKYAEFKAATGSVPEAVALLQAMTRESPDYLPAWNFLAQIAFREKHYEDTLAHTANVLSRDPANPEAMVERSAVWIEQGEGAKAEETLLALVHEHPNLSIAKYHLGRVYLNNNKLDQAATMLEESLKISPDYLPANLLLASVNLRRGDSAAVATAMESVLKKRPTLAEPQLLLVEAYRSLSRLDEAVNILKGQCAAAPDNAGSHFLLGLVLSQHKQPGDARKEMEAAVTLDPANSIFAASLIQFDLSEKKFDAAFARARQKGEQEPKIGLWPFWEGQIHLAKSEATEAEACLRKALELEPTYSAASEQLAKLFSYQKRWPESLAQLQLILSRRPDDPFALTLSGLIYERTGAFAQAQAVYEKILTTKPTDAQVMNNLAYIYAEKTNDLKRAYELARKARTLQPGDPGTADTLGWVLFKQGEYSQALPLLQEAAGKLSDNPEVQFHLAEGNYMMGNLQAAQAAFTKAEAAPAEFPGKSEIPFRLALLKGGAGSSTVLDLAKLEALAKERPNDPLVSLRIGEAQSAAGAWPQAAAAFEQSLKSNPGLVPSLLALARLHAGPLQDIKRAQEYADKARRISPTDPEVSGTLGSIFFQAGNLRQAYPLLQDRARQEPVEPKVQFDLARALYGLGRSSDASRLLQVLSTNPEDPSIAKQAQEFAGWVKLLDNAPALAARQVEVDDLLKREPRSLVALLAKAALLRTRGNGQAAAAVYGDALQAIPDFVPAQKALAELCLRDLHDVGQAFTLATKVHQALPEDLETTGLLAEVNYERKEFAYAAQLLQEVARNRPLDARHLFLLGTSQSETGAKAAGRKTLEEALTAGLPEPMASAARQTLSQPPQ